MSEFGQLGTVLLAQQGLVMAALPDTVDLNGLVAFRGHAQLSSHMVEHAAHKPPLQRLVTMRTGREASEVLPEHDERLPAFSAYTREPGYRMQRLESAQDTGQAYGTMATYSGR